MPRLWRWRNTTVCGQNPDVIQRASAVGRAISFVRTIACLPNASLARLPGCAHRARKGFSEDVTNPARLKGRTWLKSAKALTAGENFSRKVGHDSSISCGASLPGRKHASLAMARASDDRGSSLARAECSTPHPQDALVIRRAVSPRHTLAPLRQA